MPLETRGATTVRPLSLSLSRPQNATGFCDPNDDLSGTQPRRLRLLCASTIAFPASMGGPGLGRLRACRQSESSAVRKPSPVPAHPCRHAVGGGARKLARSRHPHDFSILTMSLSPRFCGQTQHPLRTHPRSRDVLDDRRRQRDPSQISTRDLRRTRRNGRGTCQRMPQAENKPSDGIASTSASNSASGMAPRMFRLYS
ncbi:hypothetical protein PHO31112_04641 [Pandoraea horticolens]|uniref:Uncharacterized protein n=1 Tax=Pandoraea horticolens TaxID=2508298 RepID=A0A5E4YMN0_9BURK|nr:hypothetical protein PHO31112_04641 [Pandoraea horticolens]